MKLKNIIPFAALVACVCSVSAMATETAVLNAKGTLTPDVKSRLTSSACDITFSSGSADYGTLSASELAGLLDKGGYQLGTKVLPYTITCNSPIKVGVNFTAANPIDKAPFSVAIVDVGKNISSSENIASLGEVDGVVIGYYGNTISDVKNDGVSKSIIYTTDGGAEWRSYFNGTFKAFVHQNGLVEYSWGENRTPEAARNISGVINVGVAINPDILPKLTTDISFDANTTLTLKYL